MLNVIELFRKPTGLVIAWTALFLAGVVSLWWLPVLPFTDLPNHLLEAYVLQGHLSAAYESKIFFYSPACLHAIFCAMFPSVEIGNKVFYSLYLLLMPLSLLLLIKVARGDKWLALLSFCFLYSYSITWGFANFTIGIALSFLSIYAYIGMLTAPSPRRFAFMTFLLALMFYAHCLLFLFVCAVMGVCTILLAKVPLKSRIVAVSPVFLPGALFLFWLLHSDAWHTQSSTLAFLTQYYSEEYIPSLRSRFDSLLTLDNAVIFDGARGRFIALLWSVPVIALLPFVLKRTVDGIFRRNNSVDHTAQRPPSESAAPCGHTRTITANAQAVGLVFLMVAAGCFFLLPDRIPDQHYLFERFSILVLLALIWTGSFALPAGCRYPMRLLTAIMVLTSVILWSHYFWQFGEHAFAFKGVLKSTPELRGKSLAAIIDDTDYRGRPTFFHFQNYHAIFNDGLAPSHATRYRFSLIACRKDGVTPSYCNYIRSNSYIECLTSLYGMVDFLLARGSDVIATVMDHEEFALCSRQNGWALFRLTGKKPRCKHIAPNTMHHRVGQRQSENERQGAVFVAQQTQNAPDWLAFGHTVLLSPGRCVIEFDLIVTNASASATVATVDIARNSGREILAQRDVRGTTAPPITVEFSVTNFTVVEPRVFFHGQGDVTLRGIDLQIFPPENH